jgi:hypothetical protein
VLHELQDPTRTRLLAEQYLDSDGWARVREETFDLGMRYMEIMCKMNRRNYSADPFQQSVRRMIRQNCDYYYYPGDGFEVAGGFKWMRQVGKYRVMSCGFTGGITPVVATQIMTEKLLRFMRQKRVSCVTAIRPLQMDSPEILQVYDLLTKHPQLSIRGGHEIKGGIYWWIRPRAEMTDYTPLDARPQSRAGPP